jgi:hypothetical protein
MRNGFETFAEERFGTFVEFFLQMMSHKNKDPKWITESNGKGGNNKNDNNSSKNNNNKNDKELSTPASKPKAPSVPVSSVFFWHQLLFLLLLLLSCL